MAAIPLKIDAFQGSSHGSTGAGSYLFHSNSLRHQHFA
jgi:hypothetical protein